MGDYIKQEVFMGLRCFIQATAIDAASASGWETLLEDYLSTTIDTQEWVKTSVEEKYTLIIESSFAMLKEAWNKKTASKGVEHTNLISGCIIFLVTQAFSELFGVDSNNNEWEQSRHFTHLSELLDDEDERLAINYDVN
jgi:hypothetical protein